MAITRESDMPTLKYKDGSTWKELSLGGGAAYNGANVNIIGNANANVTYTNAANTDKGTIKLNASGLGSVVIGTSDTYTFTDTTNNISSAISVTDTYTVYLKNVIGVCIDTTNSNPTSAVTYVGQAAGKTAGWNTWKDTQWFKNMKPCVIDGKTNAVKYYLNRDNYTQKADGTASTLDGTDGNVMVEIPRMGVKFERIGTKQYIYLTTDNNVPGFQYYAHSLNTINDCSHIYVGVYLASIVNSSLTNNFNSRLVSVSGKQIPRTGNSNASSANQVVYYSPSYVMSQYIRNKNAEVQVLPYHVWQLLLAMFVIVYKTLDIKTIFPEARETSSTSYSYSTGSTNSLGMQGSTSVVGRDGIKCLGLEDFIGTTSFTYLYGILLDSSGSYYLNYDVNDIGKPGYTLGKPNMIIPTNYIMTDRYPTGYMTDIIGTNELCFAPSKGGGSATTYYCSNNQLGSMGGRMGFGRILYGAFAQFGSQDYDTSYFFYRVVIKKLG